MNSLEQSDLFLDTFLQEEYLYMEAEEAVQEREEAELSVLDSDSTFLPPQRFRRTRYRRRTVHTEKNNPERIRHRNCHNFSQFRFFSRSTEDLSPGSGAKNFTRTQLSDVVIEKLKIIAKNPKLKEWAERAGSKLLQQLNSGKD